MAYYITIVKFLETKYIILINNSIEDENLIIVVIKEFY